MAELPDFPLAPWELPPDSTQPLVAPATFQFRAPFLGLETDFLGRVVPQSNQKSAIFVRSLAQSEQGNWSSGEIDSARLRAVGLELLKKRLKDNLEAKRVRRVFHLAIKNEVCRVVVRSRWRGGMAIQINDNKEISFFSLSERDFVNLSASEARELILTALNDENSEVNFARRWRNLSDEEKYGILLSWQRGSPEEWVCLMRLIALCFLPGILPSAWWVYLPEKRDYNLVETSNSSVPTILEKPVSIKHWQRALIEFFGPVWNDEILEANLYAQEEKPNCFLFWTSAQHATHHEILEAAAQLREWIQAREKSGEISAQSAEQLRDTLK